MGPVTITGAVTFGNFAQISLNGPGNFTISAAGTANFAQVTNANKPTSIFIANGSFIANSGSTINFAGGGSSAYSVKIALGGTYTLAGNTIFGNANYAFYGPANTNLPLTGCSVFKAGTATLDVRNGNLTTGAGGIYFNPPSGTQCGQAVTFAASGNSYALRVQSGGSYTIGAASGDPASFGPANYGFTNGPVTINGTATFPAGTTNVNIATGNLITAAASTLNFAGGSGSNYAFAAQSGTCSSGNVPYCLSGTATFGTGSPTAPNYAFYNGGLTANSGSNTGFGPANYYLDSGPFTVNGCTAFQGGTSTINIHSGSLTESSTGSMTFNPNSAACGVSYTGVPSQYNIETVGSGNGVDFGGSAALNAGTYYFMNSANSGGNGVSITGGTAGSPVTLAGDIYSVERGSFAITSTGHATIAAGTLCAPSASPAPSPGTCIYMKNGGFSNAGTATFSAGTIYFWDGSGGFTNTSTGALTFTGGNDSNGAASNYYFFIPSANIITTTTSTALTIDGTANLGAATYYVVNGGLTIDGTLSCPNCVVGAAGETFVLTATGNTTPNYNVGVLTIGDINNAFTTTAPFPSAPGTGPYAGLLFFQDRHAAADYAFSGNSSSCPTNGKQGNCSTIDTGTNTLIGAIYLPQGAVAFQGNPGGNCLVLIDSYTTFNGTPSLSSSSCPPGVAVTATISKAVLTQ